MNLATYPQFIAIKSSALLLRFPGFRLLSCGILELLRLSRCIFVQRVIGSSDVA